METSRSDKVLQHFFLIHGQIKNMANSMVLRTHIYVVKCSIKQVFFAQFLNPIVKTYYTASYFRCFHKTKAFSQNVTNAPEGAFTPNLKNVEVTVQNKLYYCMENKQRAITPNVWCLKLCFFLRTALLPNEIYLPIKFQVSSSGQNSRMKIKKEE